MLRRAVLSLLALLLAVGLLPASDLLDEGEKLILDNKLREAGAVLEQALKQEPAQEKIYLYLGVIYEQLGDSNRAVSVMSQGLALGGPSKYLLFYNIANSLFKQGEYAQAEAMYSQALALDATFGDAYLNRGNTRLRTAQYPEAIADYVFYLRLQPDAAQKPQIEQVIAILRENLAAEELARAETAARQKALMDGVLDSLRNASSDAKNIGAGSEQVQVDFQASDIED